MALGWRRTGAEGGEQSLTSYGIRVQVVCRAKDNSRLESDAAKDTAIQETLSCDSNRSYLAHLLSTIGHPFIHEVDDLQTHLLDQVVVQHGAARRGKVGGLQH